MILVRRIGSARDIAIRTQMKTIADSSRQRPIAQSQNRERRRRGGSRMGPPGIRDGAAEGAAKIHLYSCPQESGIGYFLHRLLLFFGTARQVFRSQRIDFVGPGRPFFRLEKSPKPGSSAVFWRRLQSNRAKGG